MIPQRKYENKAIIEDRLKEHHANLKAAQIISLILLFIGGGLLFLGVYTMFEGLDIMNNPQNYR